MRRSSVSGVRVAVVGAASLRGKELKEVLEDRRFPSQKLHLLDDSEAVGLLTEYRDEPALIQAVDSEDLRQAELVFFASTSSEFTRAQWPSVAAGPATVIDLSHALIDVPEAAPRIPFLEKEISRHPRPESRWFIVPHAAAIVLLTIWARLSRRFRVRRVVAHVFEPVSERGAAGVDELQEQTVGLLSFQQLPRTVFDTQVAFNLTAEYGPGSRVRLQETESVIRLQVERFAADCAARLALRVIQVPVFHGLVLSALVELEDECETSALHEALQGPRVSLLGDTGVNAVAVAAKEDILVAPVRRDGGQPHSFWLWAAADNLRLTACTAVEIAEELVG